MSVVEAHVQCLIEIQDVVNTQVLMSVDLFNSYVLGNPWRTIVSNKDCAAEEVEASTRVAILAKDTTPVLLHCSSGVRRTGVFIAIDAVRGKMQKHKEA
ncbi:uncharacterized protein BXZ73DRAFT_100156 [Epithele typhae]|uniref:uncharacterized protein n=1 Tax=Epithele typhae TaxID=378194 RepID=UPI002007AA4D|nr:uncharacterized protein BXZ73DRAFT_100156 [Epithele typhae]KAH9936734.1 hypothetical protein BXZ73DRAFT_100156 [Epithele typhae]